MKQELDKTSSIEKTTLSTDPKKPVVDLYQPYRTPRVLYELIRNFAKVVYFLTMRVHLRGRYNIPRKGPYIIAANHLSWLDIPMIPSFVPGKVVFMAKEELFESKAGWLVRFLGAFPVKRGEGDRRALRAADAQLKEGRVLVIFPEGTRSKSHTLGKVNDGLGLIALRSGMPVLPVAISGSENGLKKFGAHITISYGEPFVLKPEGTKITRDDIQSATNEVMQRISDMLPARYRGIYGEQAPQIDEPQA